MFRESQEIGQYKLIRKLGKGGFGEVWLAEKRSQFVTKRVAVKLPLDDQVNFEAIRQEATLWEQASGHANVLPIIDADVYDGQVVIVSEYADGGSLHDKLKTEGKLPIKQAVEMTIGILNGLEFLHNKRIIHRDIKPQNILLQGDTPRLADFGISRAMQTTAISSTIIGTDAYMSPEAFDGKRSVQTDIWAVGVVLYQLLKGILPFPQEHPSERMFAIIQKDFEPLSDEAPFKLQQIIKKALAKLPENRFESASQMRDDLQRFLRDENVSHFTRSDLLQTQQTSHDEPTPQTQQVSFAEQILPIQKSKPFLATNSQNETETISYPMSNFEHYEYRKSSNVWIYVLLVIALVAITTLGTYFLTKQPTQTDSSKNEMPEVMQKQLSSNLTNSGSSNVLTKINSNTITPTSGLTQNSNMQDKPINIPLLTKIGNNAQNNSVPASKKEKDEDNEPKSQKSSIPMLPTKLTSNPTEKPVPKTISGGVVNGKATNLVKPPYPAAARAVRAAGAVNVQVTIDESGNVISASAVSGHPLLRAAAVQAARSSKFSPTTISGQPVKVTGVVVYNFVP
jgi:TonB family protein